ncbi:MAG: hypothetical protein AAGG11_19995 [Pseudomonadota bacterium]
MTERVSGAARALLTLPCLGLLMLILIELMRESALPPTAMLAGLFSASVAAVVLLAVSHARGAGWCAFGIALLTALFHALHILERALVGDLDLFPLITMTMLIPAAAGAVLLARGLHTAPASR